jgi:N-acetyl-gamma-glutamyl-phosphate reductase common form
MTASVSTVVLGGSGYVAGELLRLLAGHPQFKVAAVLSDSQPGALIADAFPHLHGAYPDLRFATLETIEALLQSTPLTALFCAAPHGAAAALIDRLLKAAAAAGTRVHCVDISADFRHPTAAAYETLYRHPHGAPQRIAEFSCAVPEHLVAAPTPHIAHPGCFATAVLLASVPLLALGLVEPRLFVTGITGSTGSGRKPAAGTHHPQRHSDLYAYNALSHRHTPEIIACTRAASGTDTEYHFVPHSGPYARGIHVTIQATLKKALDGAAVRAALADFYRRSPFVWVGEAPPHVKDVTASNYAHLFAATDGSSVAVMAAIDNLTKGAAGGAVQWMNRLLRIPESTGLTAPAPGWT